MDVKTTFLHGVLDEEIYMKQLEVFIVKGKKVLDYKLKKSLYGLKQSPRIWFHKFSTYILSLGFIRSKANHYVYCKQVGEHFVYVVLYVDDMLLVGNDMKVIKEVKSQLSSKIDMKDLGAANFILGMEIKRNPTERKLWLNQRKYVQTILHRFNMQECKPLKVPIPIGARLSAEQFPKTKEEEEDMSHVPYVISIGSLMYVMVCTKPDIPHVVRFFIRYISKSGKEYQTVAKRVFKYFPETTNDAVCYQGKARPNRVLDLHGFFDVDLDGDLDNRISTSRYFFNPSLLHMVLKSDDVLRKYG